MESVIHGGHSQNSACNIYYLYEQDFSLVI